MRKLVWIAITLATLWCLWWFGASALLQIGVERWLAERRTEGWQADAQSVDGGGFPKTLVAHLKNPSFADPETGVAVSLDDLRLEAQAARPGKIRLVLPMSPLRIATPEGRAELHVENGRLELDVAFRSVAGPKRVKGAAGPWQISREEGSMLSANTFDLSMQQTEQIEVYDIALTSDGLRLGEVPRAQLRIPSDWPAAFDALAVDMTVTFDRPWDMRAVEERRPQPRRIDLRLAEAAWGALNLKLAADLALDENGQAAGKIRIQAENWRQILKLAVDTGTVPRQSGAQLERVLERIARASGNPETLDATLNAERGRLLFGIIPIGLAPRIQLR